jgi:hypothetical protein
MRLNFWQWLGLILLIGAGGYWIYEQQAEQPGAAPQTQNGPPVIPPTTIPVDPTTGPAAP